MKMVFKIFYLSLLLIQPACFSAWLEQDSIDLNKKAAVEVDSKVNNDSAKKEKEAVNNEQAKKLFEAALQSTNSSEVAKTIAKIGLFTIFKEKMWTADDLTNAAKSEFQGCIIEAINQTVDSTLHPEALFCWGNIKHYGNDLCFSTAIKYYNLAVQQELSLRAKFLACFGILKIADESQKMLISEIDSKFLIDRKKINLQKCCSEIIHLCNDEQIGQTVDKNLIEEALAMAISCKDRALKTITEEAIKQL